jgi:hypothetical protein
MERKQSEDHPNEKRLVKIFRTCGAAAADPYAAMSTGNSYNVLLETIGVLSAMEFTSPIIIGALADGHSNKTYDDNFTIQMLADTTTYRITPSSS